MTILCFYSQIYFQILKIFLSVKEIPKFGTFLNFYWKGKSVSICEGVFSCFIILGTEGNVENLIEWDVFEHHPIIYYSLQLLNQHNEIGTYSLKYFALELYQSLSNRAGCGPDYLVSSLTFRRFSVIPCPSVNKPIYYHKSVAMEKEKERAHL